MLSPYTNTPDIIRMHGFTFERRFTQNPVRISGGSTAGTGRTVRGYAAVFGKLSEPLADQNGGAFRETIARGAFDRVLGAEVVALFNHDPNLILARTKDGNGTLRIGADATGLWYQFEAPETTVGNDLVISLRRGDIYQSSFGFSVAPGGATWSKRSDGVRMRTITRIERLVDVSAVTFPAYTASTSGLSDDRSPERIDRNSRSPNRDLWAARLGLS